MPDVQHNALTGSELHEPKGISAATANETYVADGAGGGAWDEPEPKGAGAATAGEVYVANGAAGGAWTPREYHLTGVIADVSTSSTVYIAVPYSGTVVKILTVLEGAIITADSTILMKDNAANTMGGVTVAFTGSAAGDVDFDITLVNADVTDNDFITVQTDGASGNTVALRFTITIERDD